MHGSAVFQRGRPARVVVLTQQKPTAEIISLTLNHGVFVTRDAENPAHAVALIREWHPHLAVISVDIAGDCMKKIVASKSPALTCLPVLGLTRRADIETKLAAFEQGVDDIVTVPFSPEELLARALALTRRSYGQSVTLMRLFKVGELEIDILDREVRVGSSKLHLTSVERSLLYLLAANAGRLLTRDEITDALWGVDQVMASNIIDRHIRNLREKLQDDWRQPRFISTVPGQGYRFIAS